MAKQKKPVITARIEKLKSLGYESVTDGQGAYQTIREVDRLTIERKDIEYMTDDEWNVVIAKVDADHTKHLKPIEGENIPHESAAAADANGPGTTMIVTMDVDKDIATFDVNKAVIAEWEKKYAHLKFTSLEDVDTNKLIKEGKKLAQKTRIGVEKRESFLKAPYIAGSKKIKAVADDYVFLLSKIEDPLDAQIKLMKDAEDAEELRKQQELEKEINRRVEVLKEAGMKFDGSFYCIAERSMDIGTIKAMTPEAFDDLLEKVKGDKKRLDEEEAKRLEDLKKERLTTRAGLLVSIGMTVDAVGTYTSEHLEGVKVLEACLTDEADDAFMKLFSSLSGRINDAKTKAKDDADKKAKERTVALRSKLIIAAGLLKVDWIPGTTQTGFYFKNAFAECRLPLPLVESQTDEEFDATLEVMEKEVAEAKDKAIKKEEDDKAAEQLANTRREELVGLGMTSAPKLASYVFTLPDVANQVTVAYELLTDPSPDKWRGTIDMTTRIIKEIKEEQQAFEDKAAKDKKDKEDKDAADLVIFQERQYKLVNLNMVIVDGSFTVKNEFGDIATITIEEVKAIDADNWPRRLMEVTQAVEDVKTKTITKRGEAVAHAEALKPQITRFREYLASFIDINAPEITEPELEGIMTAFKEDLGAAIIKANKALEQVNA